MLKIKFMLDSAGDIPDRDLREYDIDMLSVPIAMDGKSYLERKSFSIVEFYKLLAVTKETPVTSRIPMIDFYNAFKRAKDRGYTAIVCVTINAAGSGTNASAQAARDRFYREFPDLAESYPIHIVDSGSYAMAFGFPTLEAAKMAREGHSLDEILAYLDDWFACVEIYLGVYTLEYAKKSGRISSAAAFAGDVLGLRPVISMIAGDTKIVGRVRGDRNLATKLLDFYREKCADFDAPALVVHGVDTVDYAKELARMIESETGRVPLLYLAGASIVINSGPRMLAIVCKGSHRRSASAQPRVG